MTLRASGRARLESRHGRTLQIPERGGQAEATDDDGHLTQFLNHLEHVHEWLLERPS